VTRLKLARLGFVTDTRGGGRAWEDFCRDLFLAGVDLIVIQQPGLDREGLQAAVQAGLRAGFGSGRIVGVAQPDPPEAGLDLLHLSTRQPVTPDPALFPLIGRSAESVFEAQRQFADPSLAYLTIGPVQEAGGASLSRGLDLVTLAAALAPVADPASKPWFAVGGVDSANLDAVLEAGARRVFVHRAIARAADPVKTARDWANRLRHVWRDDPALRDYAAAVRRADRGDE
jgi:thiamine-phosphate pyrophosphorylase